MKHKSDCSELLRMMNDYIDQDLPEELCRELEKHLHECEDCTSMVNTIKRTVDLFKSDTCFCPECPPDVKQRLADVLDNLIEQDESEP